jgi:1-acyl-sn-glycerol-3-phosphate acyltransferase
MKQLRALIRMISFVILTFGIYAIWFIGSFILPNKMLWRQIIFRKWALGFKSIAGANINVNGEPPRPPFLMVSNHLSYFDVVVLRCVVESVFVAKKDIRHWFGAGKIISDMGTIFIDRNSRRDIPRAGQQILQKLDEGEGVVVFPEGTSSIGDRVLPFNSSFLEFAAKRELPVSYASIGYKTSSGELPASIAVCWWDDTVFVRHLWRLFGLKGFDAIINFGDYPLSNQDRKKLAQELHRRVSENFVAVD